MSDKISSQIRSKIMRAIKSKNTKIELLLRSKLWSSGVRYRINNKNIYGHPDIALPRIKLAIFCDGDFWHGNKFDDKRIKTNQIYWNEKIKRNKERDLEVTMKLRDDGWTVLRFWESDIKDNLAGCVAKIASTANLIKEKEAHSRKK